MVWGYNNKNNNDEINLDRAVAVWEKLAKTTNEKRNAKVILAYRIFNGVWECMETIGDHLFNAQCALCEWTML